MKESGTLYIVATPIGNLSDISHRAAETLRSVDIIACEDTRHTLKLCRHLNITASLTSYYREKEQEKAETLVQLLLTGKNIALVSDAGTPAISDPGAILVKKARNFGVKIVAIAGPSSLTAALSVAGLLQSQFFFGGFVSANNAERIRLFRTISTFPFPLVFFESPHRINSTLADMALVLGDRQAQLFRELTKIHEECMEGTLSALRQRVKDGVKGELVLIVQGMDVQRVEKPEDLDDLLLWYRDHHQSSLKDAVRNIANDLDLPRSKIYQRALSIWHNGST